jgi:CheY-like chemotaxis protein
VAAILLAEDDNAVREFVTRALKHDGHDVTAVEDGSLALEALASQDSDMLLSVVVMPELDGIAPALKVAKDYRMCRSC